MNERVKELAKEARDFAIRVVDVRLCGSLDEELDAVFEQKFTELIVKEYIEVINKEHKMALEFEWDTDDTVQSIKDSVKKHFGVK